MLNPLLRFAGARGAGLFQTVFMVTTVVSVGITFYSLISVNPVAPLEGGVVWLFALNFILIFGMAWLLVQRYQALQLEGPNSGRLIRRFLIICSLSAVIPATIVAFFLGETRNKDVDDWFNTRFETLVEQTAGIAARDYDQSVIQVLRTTGQNMALDMSVAADGLTTDIGLYNDYLGRQASLRQLLAAYVVNSEGIILASARSDAAPESFAPVQPSAEDMTEARQVGDVLRLPDGSGLTSALLPLTAPENTFLYIFKAFDPEIFNLYRQTSQALDDYRTAAEQSSRLRLFFVIGYAQIVGLALLMFARIGLEVGARVTGPLRSLAAAARDVQDGYLETRVTPPGTGDELDSLAHAFNAMTQELGDHREALETARKLSEERRIFLETLMTEVSTGIIRTDEQLMITLANPSAEALLASEDMEGRSLGDVIPEFKPLALTSIGQGEDGDASIEISRDGEARHFRVQATGDGGSGCVLTFDDTTRLVTAQRHMAWRDVARRIAHEIRNPLTPIMLSAERLKRRYKKKFDAEDEVFERSLETIMRQVNDIGRMVETFSNFARMPKPAIAEFHLQRMLEEAVFSQRMTAPEMQMHFTSSVPTLFYNGDQRLLAQAFTNLIKNAVEAIGGMPISDDVEGQVEVSLELTANAVQIAVTDNGPGFPTDKPEELLEPYVTTRERGSGLGLAIVNRVIIDHGGSIALKQRDGGLRGGQVLVTLPIDQVRFEEETALDTEPSSPEELKV